MLGFVKVCMHDLYLNQMYLLLNWLYLLFELGIVKVYMIHTSTKYIYDLVDLFI